ncbi:hypothetical protein D9M69_720290 [compost metagenome]
MLAELSINPHARVISLSRSGPLGVCRICAISSPYSGTGSRNVVKTGEKPEVHQFRTMPGSEKPANQVSDASKFESFGFVVRTRLYQSATGTCCT